MALFAGLIFASNAAAQSAPPRLTILQPGIIGCASMEAFESILADFDDATVPAPQECLQIRRPIPALLQYGGHIDLAGWRYYWARSNTVFIRFVLLARKPLTEVLGRGA